MTWNAGFCCPRHLVFFPFLFSLLQCANTSTNIGSTKQCFQTLLQFCGLTLPLCQEPEPAVHSSAALWPYLFFLLLPVPAAGRRSKASRNLSQLGNRAGHPSGAGKRRFCQTLCTTAASRLSSEVFLLCFLSN